MTNHDLLAAWLPPKWRDTGSWPADDREETIVRWLDSEIAWGEGRLEAAAQGYWGRIGYSADQAIESATRMTETRVWNLHVLANHLAQKHGWTDPPRGRGRWQFGTPEAAIRAFIDEAKTLRSWIKNGFASANSANTFRLFPRGVPDNPDVVDLVVRLSSETGARIVIARKFTGETPGADRKAQSLLAQIRRMKKNGRVNL
jgi:hypothetical protein